MQSFQTEWLVKICGPVNYFGEEEKIMMKTGYFDTIILI